MRIQFHALKLAIVALAILASAVFGPHHEAARTGGPAAFAQRAGAGAAAVQHHRFSALPDLI